MRNGALALLPRRGCVLVTFGAFYRETDNELASSVRRIIVYYPLPGLCLGIHYPSEESWFHARRPLLTDNELIIRQTKRKKKHILFSVFHIWVIYQLKIFHYPSDEKEKKNKSFFQISRNGSYFSWKFLIIRQTKRKKIFFSLFQKWVISQLEIF